MPGTTRYPRLMQAVDKILSRFGPSDAWIATRLSNHGWPITPQAIGYWRRVGRLPHKWAPRLDNTAAELGFAIPRRDMLDAVMGD